MTAALPRTALPMSGPSSTARSSIAAIVDVANDASLGAAAPPPAAGVCVRVMGVAGERVGVGSCDRKAEMNSSTVRRTARPWLMAPLGDGAMVTARTP
ncbi:hypothetical protein AB1Y20_001214 [Prymnesium parvum]|uniref:Uncharacterized protein n=1 Tax=Prymnesium parvum TaxID=97485 RepID=A0AB34KCR0_PRYPA